MLTSKSLPGQSSSNMVLTYAYAHPQHMTVVNHIIHVFDIDVRHHINGYSLNITAVCYLVPWEVIEF